MSSRTSSIGVISTGFSGGNVVFHAYAGGVLDGILRTAEEHDYNVSIFTRVWTGAEECGGWLHECPIDGMLILAPSIHSDLVATVKACGIPAVATSADAFVLGIPTVDSDNDMGVSLATEHLISLGHTRIAHLAGTMGQTSSIIRRDAFYRVMVQHGLDVPEEFLVECGYFMDRARKYATRLLGFRDRPTAIFCANDDIALGACQAAADLGIKIPDDLSLVGYDDTVIGRFNEPPLTTVRQPFSDMGTLATSLLLQGLMGQKVDTYTRFLAPELMVRGSTAPCR